MRYLAQDLGPFRRHGKLYRAQRDCHGEDHGDGHPPLQPEQLRSGRIGRPAAALLRWYRRDAFTEWFIRNGFAPPAEESP